MAIQTGQGTTLSIDVAGGTTFTKVAPIKNVDTPKINRTEFDITNLDSTSKEFAFGLKDNGDVSFLIVEYKPLDVAQKKLIDAFHGNTEIDCKIEIPIVGATTDEIYEFTAFVTAMDLKPETDSILEVPVTLKITGDVTYTAPTV